VTVAIVGVGESEQSRRSGQSPSWLSRIAVDRALCDAGLDYADVDGFVIEGLTTPRETPIDEMARSLCLPSRPFSAQGSIAGAGIVGAPQLASMAIESGLASVVVTYFGITLDAVAGSAYAVHAEDPWKAAFEMPAGFYGQPAYFGAIAQRYDYEYGLAPEHLHAVASAARAHAARTPGALRPGPLTLDDYRASPMVAEPLRKADCCLTNDGAIAYVMTSLERARDLRKPPVVVGGVEISSASVSMSEYFTQSPNYLSTPASLSGPRAMAQAGVTPSTVDVAELYDCFTITTIMQLEDLGFAERGSGGHFAIEAGIGPGGQLPVNTHGGLLAHSYMLAGNHVIEAVRQLRGERGDGQVNGAEVALVTGLGIPDHASLVLVVDR
jgi:acetyl-CoA acetyltransferase